MLIDYELSKKVKEGLKDLKREKITKERYEQELRNLDQHFKEISKH